METLKANRRQEIPTLSFKWHLGAFHCKYNFMHIFFTQEELDSHLVECEQNCEAQRSKRLLD